MVSDSSNLDASASTTADAHATAFLWCIRKTSCWIGRTHWEMGSGIVPHGRVFCHRERAKIGGLLAALRLPFGHDARRRHSTSTTDRRHSFELEDDQSRLCVVVLCASPTLPPAQRTGPTKHSERHFGVQETSHDWMPVHVRLYVSREVCRRRSRSMEALVRYGAGYKVWKNLAVGLGYRGCSPRRRDLEANVPDPNSSTGPRGVTGVA